MKKSIQFDREAAKKLFHLEPWKSKHRSSGLRAFIEGASPQTQWPSLIEELKGMESQVGASEEPRLSKGLEYAVASEWAKHDVNEAMTWYVDESNRDLGSSLDANHALSILRTLPGDERYRIVDWLGDQRESDDAVDQVIVTYGKSLSRLPVDPEIVSLVGLLQDENDRYAIVQKFVQKFVQVTKSFGGAKRRGLVEGLDQLVAGAALSDERAEGLRSVIHFSSPDR
ncbi:MAG: hypothetical protein QNK83_01425 [Akkermansiaceae bacterium]